MSERATMKSYSPVYQKINAVIDRLEQDKILYRAENFIERMNALDVLEFQLLDDIENVTILPDAEKSRLMQRAEMLKQKLVDVNEKLFTHLLLSIRSNDRATVTQYFKQAERQISRSADDDYLGYDEIDMLVNGLLEVAFVPPEPEERDADMIYYQPTPARIILKLIDELHLTLNDTFYDLGSGLGHVPILVNLLTNIKTKGIELENAYFQYSNECLKKLGLSDVEFINADARDVDYCDGTIFYMYTPFQGEILRQVLKKLEAQSERHPIRVCTYGPCTLQVSKLNWLRPIYQTGKQEGSLSIFSSL
ncbi:MAG: hypothetical protein ABI947_08300 [Chloroflexota bacterium]